MNRLPIILRNQQDGLDNLFVEQDNDFFDPANPSKTDAADTDDPNKKKETPITDTIIVEEGAAAPEKKDENLDDVTELIDLSEYDDESKVIIKENLKNAQNYLKLSDNEKKSFDETLDDEQKKLLNESIDTIKKLTVDDDAGKKGNKEDAVDYKNFTKSGIAALNKRYGTTVELKDEDITEENYLDIIATNMLQHIDKKAIVSPQAAMIDELMDNGASFDEAVESVRKGSYVQAMKDEDIARIFGENVYGLQNEELNDFIKSAKSWEIKKYRAQIESYQQQQFDTQIETQRVDNAKAYQAEYEKNLNETFESFKKRSDIYGVPIDAKHKEEFRNVLKEYTQENPKTGKAKIMEMLEDNNKLSELVYLMHYGPSSIPGTLTREKNKVKESIKKKLDLSPSLTSSSTKIPKMGIDFSKFDLPDDGS